MSWLYPGFLLGFAAAVVPIVLHFLRRRRREPVVFPSLRFLAATQRKNLQRHRLRRRVVLALRCLAFAALALAFARPFLKSFAAPGSQATIVVIDNTFSLQAKDRWFELRDWARNEIDLSSGSTLGLLLAAPRPHWLLAPTRDLGQALLALQALGPGWESGRVEPALRLAADTLSAMPATAGKIVFLGDHQRVSWAGADFSKKLPPGVTAVFPASPAPVLHQAALQSPRVTAGDQVFHATVTVRNYTGPQTRTLRVYRDGQPAPIAEQTITLAENETRSVSLDLPGPKASAYFAFKLDPDELPADDTAYATWQTSDGRALLLDPKPAANAADYVASALAATAGLAPAMRVVSTPALPWPIEGVGILRDETSFAEPAVSRLDTFLAGGGSALVFIDGDPAQQRWLARHGLAIRKLVADTSPLEIHDWSMDQTLVAALAEHGARSLIGWDFRAGWALPPDAVEPLAFWSPDAAAIGEVHIGAGHVLLCGFTADRRASEWPVQGAFVPFIHRAVVYLAGSAEAPDAAAARVGAPIKLPGGTGTWQLLDGPAATAGPIDVSESVIPDAPGVYEFSGPSGKKRFAVNVAADESDPASWSDGQPWLALSNPYAKSPLSKNARLRLADAEAEQQTPLWWWVLALAGLFLLTELGLANRTSR